ncbi:MAG: hypothetical protein ACXWUG_26460 [Polyangiales bacterium]
MRFAVMACVLAGCAPAKPVTPAGTVLFEWDASRATRAAFRGATIGARTTKDFTVTLDEKAPFVVSLHVEVAPVEFEESGKKITQTAPVSMRATVKSNDAWQLSGKCAEGPNYKMGPVTPSGVMIAPPGMLQDCSISFHRESGVLFKSSWQLGRSLIVSGDGTVKAFPTDGVKIE